jgi:hypothetical protein
LSDRDWLFGARPRRLVLEALLVETPPRDGWTVAVLCDRCGVGERGLDAHLDRLEHLGLIVRRRGSVSLADPLPALAADLRSLLRRVQAVPDR